MNNSERAWIAHLTAIRIEQRARDRRGNQGGFAFFVGAYRRLRWHVVRVRVVIEKQSKHQHGRIAPVARSGGKNASSNAANETPSGKD